MTQAHTPSAWCAKIQAQLMAALDAAWALAESSDDPAVLAKARDKARLCGQMAAEARKIVALVPLPKPSALPDLLSKAALEEDREPGKTPAAQAVAMQAALARLKRR